MGQNKSTNRMAVNAMAYTTKFEKDELLALQKEFKVMPVPKPSPKP
jgi:hypothetical protein